MKEKVEALLKLLLNRNLVVKLMMLKVVKEVIGLQSLEENLKKKKKILLKVQKKIKREEARKRIKVVLEEEKRNEFFY